VPIAAVAGIFAKETGYGFAFTPVANDGDGGLAADGDGCQRHRRRARRRSRLPTDAKRRASPAFPPPHLQVIK
jgi:stringent starvation protein B